VVRAFGSLSKSIHSDVTMNTDEARVQRQKALADKKKRLDELKARRQQRGSQTVTPLEQAQAKVAASANLEEYIEGLLKVPAATLTAPAASAPVVAADTGAKASETPLQDNITAVAAPALAAASSVKMESFEMGTQTAEDDFPPPSDYDEEEGQQPELTEEQANDPNAVESSYVKKEEELEEEAKILTAEEVERELSSETFSSFLNTASKEVERVLGSAVLADLLVDYDGETDGTKQSATKSSDGSKYISSRQIYEGSKWTATRDVTDMDWSPLRRELMLCSYHMPSSTSKLGESKGSPGVKVVSPDDTPSDSLAPWSSELQLDGLALVWNLAMPN
jgi:hypothetical protein